MSAHDDAMAVLGSLVIADGRRWGEAAVPVQVDDARAVLDPDGSSPYHFVTRARGFSKTDDGAGVLLAALLTQMSAESRCFWLAADRDQGRLAIDSIAGFVARTPEIQGAFSVESFRVTARQTGSTLEVLAADAPSSYGLRPAFAVVDELSVWADVESSRRLFDAVTTALGKIPGARALVITSSGSPAHFSYKLLEHARRDPLWRTSETEGPPPWMDPARLEEQRRRLLPSMYARLFENRWVEAEDRLASRELVLACVSEGAGDRDPEEGVEFVMSLDVGLVHDRTAVCVASLMDVDGRDGVSVDAIRCFAGSKGNPVDLGTVEAELLELSRRYNGASLVYDPFQAALLADRLRAQGVRCHEHTFSPASNHRIATRLFQLIHDTLLDLPDHQGLVDELAAVRLRESSPGTYRLDHDSNRHDDMAVAVAMACAHLIDRPPRRRLISRWAVLNGGGVVSGSSGTGDSVLDAALQRGSGSGAFA